MPTILVIEDEIHIRDNIAEILEFSQYQVYTAENGVVGIQLAQRYHPDLILCDIMMPELDGYGVLTQLRADPMTTAIPLIFLSAKPQWQEFCQGKNLGNGEYLAKPFHINELLNAIATTLPTPPYLDHDITETPQPEQPIIEAVLNL